MKKILLSIAAIAFMAGTGHAQNNVAQANIEQGASAPTSIAEPHSTVKKNKVKDSRDRLHIGGKIGVNLSNVYDSEGENFEADAKLGFVGGGFLSIPIGKYLGVQPELLWSQKGFQGNGTMMGSPYTITRTTSHIDVPVLFALKPLPVLTILAGPQYSYLVRQRDVFEGSSSTFELQQEFENENIRKNTLCFLGGADAHLLGFVFGARAGWDITNNHGDGTSSTPRYKNVWYQATVGFRF